MVGVAQLVELRIVIPVVAGSNPVVHPKLKVRIGKRDWQRLRQKVCPYKPRRSPQIKRWDWEEGLAGSVAKGLPVQTPLLTPDKEVGLGRRVSPPDTTNMREWRNW